MPNPVEKKFAFPWKCRLSNKKILDKLFSEGKFGRLAYLNFRYLPNQENHMRVTITLSKRAGNSPQRNRIKRLIREALRLSECLRKTSVDCCIYITRPPQKKPNLPEIKKYINKFLKFYESELASQ